jgi:hypothetical protein
MATYKDTKITQEFLDNSPNAYFVFGDNLERGGYEGDSELRDHSHSIGFITKKFADNKDESIYKPEEYSPVFFEELKKLKIIIERRPDKVFYISRLSCGEANKYYIWQKLIRHNLVRALESYNNVVFCWTESFV